MLLKKDYMKKGNIYWAKNRKNHPHPIVFLEWIDTVNFKACILSSRPVNNNLLIQPTYFEKTDTVGNQFEFPSKKTYLVTSDVFIKMDYWIDDGKIIGSLTEEGVFFVERNIPEQPILCSAPIWKLRPPNEN